VTVEFDRDTEEVLEKALDSGRLPGNDALKQVVLEAVVADLLELAEEDYRENTRLERHAKDLGVLD